MVIVRCPKETLFRLYGLRYGPYESTQPESRLLFIKSPEACQDVLNPVILNKSENCGGQRGPGVSAVMRLAAFASSALNGAEVGEAATVGAFQNFYYLMFVCLVKGYEYGLHWVLE